MNESLNWNHFLYLVGLIAAWSLIIIMTSRWVISVGLRAVGDRISGQGNQMSLLFSEQEKKINSVVLGQGEKLAAVMEKQHGVQLEIANLRSDMLLCYVRREDFIREIVTINTKLDRLRDLLAAAKKKEDESHDA